MNPPADGGDGKAAPTNDVEITAGEAASTATVPDLKTRSYTETCLSCLMDEYRKAPIEFLTEEVPNILSKKDSFMCQGDVAIFFPDEEDDEDKLSEGMVGIYISSSMDRMDDLTFLSLLQDFIEAHCVHLKDRHPEEYNRAIESVVSAKNISLRADRSTDAK